MAKVTVDGRTILVPDTMNALEACRAAGVDVPHFCYHPSLSIVGQCRMCMVEIEGVPKIQASCTVPVRDGMVIRASSEKALQARNATMEFLLINHPLDCPICDQAGECKLQDNAFGAGLPVSRTEEPRRLFPGYDRTEIGPHVIADMTRCIQCTRCVRFCEEIAGTGELTFVERGGHTFVWTHEGRALDNEWSACAADVCPVGALTTKEFRFRKRVWWLSKARSVCDGCEIGCNISIEHKDAIVYRYLPRVNPEVNDFWMCDYGRFLAEGLNAQDYRKPTLREGGAARETHWGEALDFVKAKVTGALVAGDPDAILVLGSARHATEESWLLAQLFGKRLSIPNLEYAVDEGPERRIKNPDAKTGFGGPKPPAPLDGWVRGRQAAPNARGAELAGLARSGEGSALQRLLDGSYAPDVLYVADAAFSRRTADPAFAEVLRRAKVLIVHARTQSPLSQVADLVLPVASLAGKDGTFINVQGRVQRFDSAFVPPPIVKTDLEVLLHLGKRFGVFDTRWTARDVFEEMRKTIPRFAGLTWDSAELKGTEPVEAPASAYDTLSPASAPAPIESTIALPLAGEEAGVSPALFDAAAGLAKIVFVWAVVLAALLPNLVWLERRGAALIQDRPGPNRVGPFGLLQALADVIKFFMKEPVIPTYADRLLYVAAPLITMIPALTTFAVIPFGRSIPAFGREISLVIADVNIGILYVFALTSIGIYGIVLAGWASNDKFALMGGIRSSAQIISYELAMGLSAITVFLAAGSLRLTSVVEYQAGKAFFGFIPHWNCFPQVIGCLIFIISAFAETNRLPFDLAEAEAELVAGYHTEYSAFRFAMFFMGEYANMVAASAMITTLYFGGWSLPGIAFTGLWGGLASIAVFAAKTLVFIGIFIWVRWTLPRFRYDQLMNLGWKVFLPASLLHLLFIGALVASRANS